MDKKLPDAWVKYLRAHKATRKDYVGGSCWYLPECLTDARNGGSCCRVVGTEDSDIYTYICHYGKVSVPVTTPADLPK